MVINQDKKHHLYIPKETVALTIPSEIPHAINFTGHC